MHHRHAHHRPNPHPDHPALPSDATIGSDQAVVEALQAYEDQNNPDQLQVAGYATSPNPSVDGDWVRGATTVVYWWYVGRDNMISQADAATFGA